jgi:hypothetical protein
VKVRATTHHPRTTETMFDGLHITGRWILEINPTSHLTSSVASIEAETVESRITAELQYPLTEAKY